MGQLSNPSTSSKSSVSTAPLKALNLISTTYTGLWKPIEKLAVANFAHSSRDVVQVLVPFTEWLPLLLDIKDPNWKKGLKRGDTMPIMGIDFAAIAAVGTWRYTKGIYTINETVAEVLLSSDFSGKIPSNILKNQPEWSIFVDTEAFDIQLRGKKVIGFWSNLNVLPTQQSTSSENFILVITPLFEEGLVYELSASIPLNPDTLLSVEESTDKTFVDLGNMAVNQRTVEDIQELNRFKKQVVQILLYINQSEPDIFENEIEVQHRDNRPAPQRIKGELRLFEAKHIRYFDVGVKAEQSIKNALNRYHELGKSQAPHIRRAHWHGYWKGSRKDNAQEFFYKWVAPVIVNGELVPEDTD